MSLRRSNVGCPLSARSGVDRFEHHRITPHDKEDTMRSIIFRGVLTAIAVFAAACSSIDSVAPTTSPATARRDVSANAANGTNMSRPIDQNVWVSCANGGAGEAVRVTGELHYEVRRTEDS